MGGVDRSSWNVNNPSVDSQRPVYNPFFPFIHSDNWEPWKKEKWKWCGRDALNPQQTVWGHPGGFASITFSPSEKNPDLIERFVWGFPHCALSLHEFLFFLSYHFCTAYGQHNGNVSHFRGAQFDSFLGIQKPITANVMTHPHVLGWEWKKFKCPACLILG